jgi:hypothetical protein
MKIELNIGLDVEGSTNTPAQQDSRATRALQVLAPFLVDSERFTVNYLGPDGDVTESSLFVRLDTNKLFSVSGIVHRLSVELDQDCISVFYPASGIGALIGPKASKWGAFDLDFFHRSTVETARLAA